MYKPMPYPAPNLKALDQRNPNPMVFCSAQTRSSKRMSSAASRLPAAVNIAVNCSYGQELRSESCSMKCSFHQAAGRPVISPPEAPLLLPKCPNEKPSRNNRLGQDSLLSDRLPTCALRRFSSPFFGASQVTLEFSSPSRRSPTIDAPPRSTVSSFAPLKSKSPPICAVETSNRCVRFDVDQRNIAKNVQRFQNCVAIEDRIWHVDLAANCSKTDVNSFELSTIA